MKLLKIFLLLLAILDSRPMYARLREQAKIDSLFKVLPKVKEDTNKVKLLRCIAYEYYQCDLPDTAIRYGNMQLRLATQLHWQNGIASSNNILGMAYISKNEPNRSLAYCETALRIYEQSDRKEAAKVAYHIGALYRNINDNAKAIKYFFEARKICESTGMCDLEASCYSSIAIAYGMGKDFTTAIEYHMKALKIAEKCPDVDSMHWLALYTNLAVSYQYKGDCDSSLPYSFKGLKLAEELGALDVAANLYGNLSLDYTKLSDYQKAVYFGHRILALSDSTHDKNHMAWALYELGHAYLSFITDTTSSAEGTKMNINGAGPKNKNALIHIALNYLERGLDSVRGILTQTVLKVKINEDLTKAYRLAGNWEKALQAYDMFVTLKDSLFSKETGAQLLTQQLKYDLDKKEVARLAEQKRNDMRQRNIRNSTLAGIAGLLMFSLVVVVQRNRVKKEKAKSELLLLNILPAEVAEELKSTGSTIARHFDNVTVLFTDFVGFTTISERLTAKQLVDELHICFTAFDGMMAKYKIEKIKTVGDAYLAVCGLPLTDERHAENVVSAAVEIRNFMVARQMELGDGTFNIRIGIHSGNVVAGVVGVRKFAYDIWGDTVNTAARMEQKSEAGKINISQTTYDLVKNKYICTYRGEIEAKNKGMQKMYFVESAIV